MISISAGCVKPATAPQAAEEWFARHGIEHVKYSEDADLVGSSLLDCHPDQARAKLRQLMEQRLTNVYTVEKNGVKKMIYQAPWYENRHYCGFVELSLEIPDEMPHFVRT